ncbi:hypothetical protein [Sphingobium sp. AP50]|nr:hypothetical protein [Sphingobium sp. AP50]
MADGLTISEAFDGASAMRLLQADAALSLIADVHFLFITGYAENADVGNE